MSGMFRHEFFRVLKIIHLIFKLSPPPSTARVSDKKTGTHITY